MPVRNFLIIRTSMINSLIEQLFIAIISFYSIKVINSVYGFCWINRNRMFGNCTNKEVGSSSQWVNASGNSMKTSWRELKQGKSNLKLQINTDLMMCMNSFVLAVFSQLGRRKQTEAVNPCGFAEQLKATIYCLIGGNSMLLSKC